MAVLSNVKCKWASVQEPNTTYEPVYEIMAMLDDKQAAQLANQGLAVKTDEEGNKFYRFKNKVYGVRKKDNKQYEKPNAKPRVVDMNKAPFEELIGNGSVVNIAYNVREWTNMGAQGVTADLLAVQVVEHVAFSGASASDPLAEFDSTDEFDNVTDDEEAPF